MEICMITGDNQHTAAKVANHLEIKSDNVYANAYPDQKREVVMKKKQEGKKVMFIGDGINDSPVLA